MLNEVQVTLLCQTIVANCYSTKKSDPRFLGEVQKVVETIVKSINYLNSLDEYQTNINGVSFEDIKIVSDFVPFIYPSIISINPTDYSAVNLVERCTVTEYDEGFEFSLHEFMNAQSMYQGYFRRSATEGLVSFKEARKSVALFDILDKCCYATFRNVHYNIGDKPYVPYELNDKFDIRLYKSGYYNMSFDDLMERYIREMYL